MDMIFSFPSRWGRFILGFSQGHRNSLSVTLIDTFAYFRHTEINDETTFTDLFFEFYYLYHLEDIEKDLPADDEFLKQEIIFYSKLRGDSEFISLLELTFNDLKRQWDQYDATLERNQPYLRSVGPDYYVLTT